jgi:hypothetical protein
MPSLHLSIGRIQDAYDAHEGVRAVAVGQAWLSPPHVMPKPGLSRLSVEADFVSEEQDGFCGVVSDFLKRCAQGLFFDCSPGRDCGSGADLAYNSGRTAAVPAKHRNQ